MPIAFDPTATVDFSLKSDADKPESQRPKFTTRYLTARENTRCQTLRDAAYAATSAPERLAAMLAAATLGLVSWSGLTGRDGQPVLCGQHDLADALTFAELDELVWAKLSAVTLGEIDRKKSVPPSPSATPTAATLTLSPAGPATPTA